MKESLPTDPQRGLTKISADSWQKKKKTRILRYRVYAVIARHRNRGARAAALRVFETVPSFLGERRVIPGCISGRHPRGFRLRVPGKPSNPDIRLPDPAVPRPGLTPHNAIADYDTRLETSSQITSRNRRGFTGSYVRSRPVHRIRGHVRICKYGSTLN